MSLPEKCPFCDEDLTLQDLPKGVIYCRNAHVLTVAPIHELDPRVVTELACSLATQAIVRGGKAREAVNQQRVAMWRARACR